MHMTITVYCILVSYYSAKAALELDQSGVLYVCHGGVMTVTCRTSADINLLRWNVTIPHSTLGTFMRSLSYVGNLQMAMSISTGMTTLYVSRSLNNSSSLPLISMISTNNATVDLNGTVMTCSGLSSQVLLATASVEIIVIRSNSGNVNITPNVNISEQFGTNNITITLEWDHKNGVFYTVSVDPQVTVNYTGKSNAQIVVSYNTKYNISVVTSLCGRNSTTFNIFNHVTCPQFASNNRVISYRNPAMVGTIATISCPHRLTLTGPNRTTCMANRLWKPDPKIASCKVDCNIPMANSNINLNYSSTLEDSLLTFQCKDELFPDDVFTARCYRNGSWIPNPSSHICATSLAANCGDPSPPSIGYIDPYTSTLEGSRVNLVHVCQDGQQSTEEIVCSPDGGWELVNGSKCSGNPDSSKNYLIISLGCSFGVLVVLLVTMTMIIIAIVIAKKKKGSLQRNIPSSNSCIGREQRNHENQGEHCSLARQFQVDDKQQTDSNIKSQYSLLLPDYSPEIFDSEKKTDSNDTTSQPTSTTLVYTDVLSFKQKPHLRVSSYDPVDKIEYAQLKEHSDGFPTQLTTSLKMESHPADHKINLDSLLMQLKPTVTDMWFQFGKAIGTKKEILDQYSQLEPDQRLVEILDNWLRNHNQQPTWNEIAEALTEIGLEQLALDIKSVYETGKLPVEIDVDALDTQLLSHSHLSESEKPPPPIPPRKT